MSDNAWPNGEWEAIQARAREERFMGDPNCGGVEPIGYIVTSG